jgi:hypothetical protein
MASISPTLIAPARAFAGLSSRAFDAVAALLLVTVIGGAYLDGWAHAHGRVDDSFFTPWHAVLYAGWALNGMFFAIAAWRGRAAGWRNALPAGYVASLAGAVIFGLGGIGDLLWHELLGIEKGIEALLSPTHLMLAVAMFLIAGGPLRAAIARGGFGSSLAEKLPVILSLTGMVSVLTFFTSPLVELGAFRIAGQAGGELVLGLILNAIFWTAAGLFATRLGLGTPAITIIVLINSAAMALFNGRLYPWPLVLGLGAGALLADLAVLLIKPAHSNRRWLMLALLIPALAVAGYFLAGNLRYGLQVRIHAWAGLIVMCAAAGCLTGYLMQGELSVKRGELREQRIA